MRLTNRGFLFALAAVAGYLIGALSFARIVARLFSPHTDMSRSLEVTVPDTDVKVQSEVISATTVRLRLGARYGCLTSVLDMVKVALPAYIIRRRWPDEPLYLVFATAGTVGHNWPVYHKFRGGRGLSPILGGMIVMDWPGTVVSNNLGFLLGYPVKNSLIITGGGIVLMLPWTLWRSRDPLKVSYVLLMNVLFWSSMRPELREYARLRREGKLKDFREARAYRIIGVDGEVREDTLTIANLQQRIREQFR